MTFYIKETEADDFRQVPENLLEQNVGPEAFSIIHRRIQHLRDIEHEPKVVYYTIDTQAMHGQG